MRDKKEKVSHAWGFSSEINFLKSKHENESNYSTYEPAGAAVSI